MDGIFLHCGWRTGGTWLWGRLRAQPGITGFYEPLHEALPSITAPQIGMIKSDNWQSRHTEIGKPYFNEFLSLMRRFNNGVPGAKSEFSFDRYFLSPNDRQADLFRYVEGLCRQARRKHRLPVVKFARSVGRLPWFRAQFPDVTHVMVKRQPWMQFASSWRCFVNGQNTYFLATPFVVLERNYMQPEVAALAQALELPIRRRLDEPVTSSLARWSETVSTYSPELLYRASFALWLLHAVHGYRAAHAVIDGDDDPSRIARQITAVAGRQFDLSNQGREPASALRYDVAAGELTVSDVRQCHVRAIAALAGRIDPAVVPFLVENLGRAESAAAADLAAAKLQFIARPTERVA